MLSKKAQYGLKALGYLAEKYGDGPVLIADIAEKKSIPIKFLESMLLLLKQHNIIQSKKGKGGGYYRTENPKNINSKCCTDNWRSYCITAMRKFKFL